MIRLEHFLPAHRQASGLRTWVGPEPPTRSPPYLRRISFGDVELFAQWPRKIGSVSVRSFGSELLPLGPLIVANGRVIRPQGADELNLFDRHLSSGCGFRLP